MLLSQAATRNRSTLLLCLFWLRFSCSAARRSLQKPVPRENGWHATRRLLILLECLCHCFAVLGQARTVLTSDALTWFKCVAFTASVLHDSSKGQGIRTKHTRRFGKKCQGGRSERQTPYVWLNQFLHEAFHQVPT